MCGRHVRCGGSLWRIYVLLASRWMDGDEGVLGGQKVCFLSPSSTPPLLLFLLTPNSSSILFLYLLIFSFN